MKLSRIFVVGYPGSIGGARTELWHTLRLWRSAGIDCTCLPTWRADPAWRRRLDRIGVSTIETRPEHLMTVPHLAGATVVSFCNRPFLEEAWRFVALQCRIVWVPCLATVGPTEWAHHEIHGLFDAYVCQSEFQKGRLIGQLSPDAAERMHLIHGAFAHDKSLSFAPRAHAPGDPFVVGMLARPDPGKWSGELWDCYSRILPEDPETSSTPIERYQSALPDARDLADANRYGRLKWLSGRPVDRDAWLIARQADRVKPSPVRARVMGPDAKIRELLGPVPDWAEILAPEAEPVADFLGTLHALVAPPNNYEEVWPRVGLEAMAAGVPLVVPGKGGWPELIQNTVHGFCCGSIEEMAERATELARNEPLRMAIIEQARWRLELEIANPVDLLGQWDTLFAGLRPHDCARGD